jgi:hypothetical protein
LLLEFVFKFAELGEFLFGLGDIIWREVAVDEIDFLFAGHGGSGGGVELTEEA